MAAVPSAPAAAPGLEHLIQLATVNVRQTRSGYNGNNYTVLSEDEVLFSVNEDTTILRGGACMANTLRANRAFLFDGVENTGRKLFRFVYISDTVELYIDNQLASVIRMANTFITPIFSINDPLLQPVIRLKGKLSKTTIYELQTNAKVPIGSIQKKWRGWKEEFFSCNDDIIINFPADLAVQYKIAVIVACVYIDFRFHDGK